MYVKYVKGKILSNEESLTGKGLIYVRKTYRIDVDKYSDDQPRDDRGRWTSGGGDSGSDGSENDSGAIKEINKPLVITDSQFGKKMGKHNGEWGIDPKNPDDREKLKQIISDIVHNHDKPVRIGEWRGYSEETLFFIKGDDAVITTQEGKFVSILKGGIKNARIKNAREY